MPIVERPWLEEKGGQSLLSSFCKQSSLPGADSLLGLCYMPPQKSFIEKPKPCSTVGMRRTRSLQLLQSAYYTGGVLPALNKTRLMVVISGLVSA
jgi:hypothetical protein